MPRCGYWWISGRSECDTYILYSCLLCRVIFVWTVMLASWELCLEIHVSHSCCSVVARLLFDVSLIMHVFIFSRWLCGIPAVAAVQMLTIFQVLLLLRWIVLYRLLSSYYLQAMNCLAYYFKSVLWVPDICCQYEMNDVYSTASFLYTSNAEIAPV